MRGNIRRRGNAWTLQVYAGRAPDGRKRYVTGTVHTPDTRAGRKRADHELALLIAEVEDQRIPTGVDVTLAQLLDRWRTHVATEALRAGVSLTPTGFVLSRDAEGHTPWRPDHVTHR